CGARVEEGQENCPACRTRMRKPGWLQRLLTFLTAGPRPRGAGTARTVVCINETAKVSFLDKTTGHRQVFHSLEELPPELRTMIRQAQDPDQGTSTGFALAFRGPDGELQTF